MQNVVKRNGVNWRCPDVCIYLHGWVTFTCCRVSLITHRPVVRENGFNRSSHTVGEIFNLDEATV